MKKFIIKNQCLIVLLICLLGYLTFSLLSASKVFEQINTSKENVINIKKDCLDKTRNDEICNYVDDYLNNFNFFSIFKDAITTKFLIINYIFPLFVIIPGILYYKRNKKNKAYLAILIYPLTSLIIALISANISTSFQVYDSTWQFNNVISYMLLYLLNTFIHGLLYLYISLFVSKKIKNYFLSVLVSLLTILGIQLLLELVINGLLGIFFHLDLTNILTIYNMHAFSSLNNLYLPVILTIIFGCLALIDKPKRV